MKKAKGITLIALVVTIIVMLILAGVSLNTIGGDNGLITNANKAKRLAGMAVLEEFLQMKYAENYEKVKEDSKVESMQALYPDYFYIPANENVGSLKYIVDSEGHIYYLIKKSGLPKDIKNGLVGGDAGKGTYSDYASLNDVYGVTSDLKVYYLSRDEVFGINKDEFDVDDTTREVFAAGSEYSNLINGGDTSKNVTAEKVRGIDELTINKDSGITNLTELYNFPSLEVLKISDANMESFDGIENASKLKVIYLTNVTSGNYDGIGRMENRLTELYIVNSKDAEIDKMFGTYDESSKKGEKAGLSNYNLTNLKVLEISGYLIDKKTSAGGLRTTEFRSDGIHNTNITKVSQLNNLSDATKKGIESLLINNNSIKNLNGIEDLTNIKTLRAETNFINNIDNLKNINLEYCFLRENSIGDNNEEALKSLENTNNSHSNLTYLRIDNNKIKKVSYLASYKSSNKIAYIYGKGNDSITDISELIVLNGKCYYEFDEEYSLSLLNPDTTTELNLENQELTFDNLNGIGKCTKIKKFSLRNAKIKDNSGTIISNENNTSANKQLAEEKVSDMLKGLTQIVDLDLDGCKFITKLDFMKDWNKTALSRVRISNTGITNISQLNNFTNLTAVMIYNSPCKVNDLNDNVIIKLLQTGRATTFCWDTTLVCAFDIDTKQSSEVTWPKSGLTNVHIRDSNHATLLDFSSVNTITSFYVCGTTNFKFDPTNITKIDGYGTNVSFSEGKQGGHVVAEFSPVTSSINAILKSFSEVELQVRNASINFSNYSNCDKIVKLSNFKEYETDYSYNSLDKLTNLKTLELLYGGNVTISDVSSLKNLTTVRITDPVGDDILTKLPIENLTTLELTNSKVTDISPLMNAKKLQTLGLVNGKIFDRFSYKDAEGTTHANVSTLQVFIDLQKNYGQLKNLYLSGCENIKAWSILEDNKDVTWTAWSGFNGK